MQITILNLLARKLPSKKNKIFLKKREDRNRNRLDN